MEGTVGSSSVVKSRKSVKDRVKVKRKTIQAVVERAIESLSDDTCIADDDDDDDDDEGDGDGVERGGEGPSDFVVKEADELCDLLRSKLECRDFLEKLETAQMSVSLHAAVVDDCSSWDVVNKNDLWDFNVENPNLDEYVLVKQEDIVEGIACFMAAYLLSILKRQRM